jgi:hypothetical protein
MDYISHSLERTVRSDQEDQGEQRPLQPLFGQLLVVAVTFVLHPGGDGHHGQIVGIGNTIDIAGQSDGQGTRRDALRQPPSRGRPLDIEGRSPAGLPNGSGGAMAEPPQPLDQADRGRGLAFL